MRSVFVLVMLSLLTVFGISQSITGGTGDVTVEVPAIGLYGMPITVPVKVDLSGVSGTTTVGLGGFVVPLGYDPGRFDYYDAVVGDLPGTSGGGTPTMVFTFTDPTIASVNEWFAMVGATSEDSVGPDYVLASFKGVMYGFGDLTFDPLATVPSQNQLSLSSKWTSSNGGPETIPANSTAVTIDVRGKLVFDSGDFDGDGISDIAFWRPETGYWYIQRSGGGAAIVKEWGIKGDIPVPGDYNNDGLTDFAVYRPSNSKWYIQYNSVGTVVVYSWGAADAIPTPGDYDDDGMTDPAFFSPSSNKWIIRASSGGSQVYSWGGAGDVPVIGDYNGDGFTDVAFYRPPISRWYVRYNNSAGGPIQTRVFSWGGSDVVPLKGDYNFDGFDDIAVFDRTSDRWLIRFTAGPTTYSVYSWGGTGSVPVPGDYDGDGFCDVAVFIPSTGKWLIRPLNSPTFTKSWGGALDLPLGR